MARMQDRVAVIKAIRSAIKRGDVEDVAMLIEEDMARLHVMTAFGSWLHVAADFGNLRVVELLIALGADVNALGGVSGGSAIHCAASEGHADVVRYLLSKGAALDVSEPERNPLFGAIYGGHVAVAKLLIESGIDTSVRYTGENMKNIDALAFAREWGRTDIIKLLQSNDGRTAI